MSTAPFDLHCFYTVDDFAALPEDNSRRYELENGYIVSSPRPLMDHMIIIHRMCAQIDPQLPAGLLVVAEIDLDLQLDRPVVRIPDLVIVNAGARGRRGLVKAEDVVLAVEVFSPGSKRLDTRVKPIEYAEAGIPNLWLVDPDEPVTVDAYTLVDGEYEESQRADHTLVTSEPCPLRIDLRELLPSD
jgi:Uma2 family endonuclease